MLRKCKGLAVGILLLWCGLAAADTITFNSLSGANNDTFTSATEAGFTVSSLAGDWRQGFLFGAPVPDIFSSSASAAIQVSNSGLFTFNSVDMAAAGGKLGASFTITGYLSGNTVFNFTGTTPLASFQTFLNPYSGQLLDRLEIAMTQGTPWYSYNIDSINVTSVPEPASLCLLGFGFFGIAARRLHPALRGKR